MTKKSNDNSSHEYAAPRTLSTKAKKIIAAILATTTGISAVTVASAVIAYETLFKRYERPNYATYPGEYTFERVKDRLSREEFYFSAGESTLKGYYYKSSESLGLVVIVHGFHAGADEFIPLAEALVKSGYDVFSYDGTGIYDSHGESAVGMCQAIVDLDNVLSYLSRTSPYNNKEIFLIGHSMGGYAVSSILALHKEVAACVAIAPMNDGYNMMVEKGREYVGDIALTAKPIFDTYQKMLFGDYVKLNGLNGINSVDIPVLIVQGLCDKTIPHNTQSIYAKKDQITNPNVEYMITDGILGGHNTVWHSLDSALYQQEVKADLQRLEKLKGDKLTDEELADYYKGVNHTLYSEPSPVLVKRILALFNKASSAR